MRWTLLLALALIAGCATKLTPEKDLLKRRNAENRPFLPQPTATRIPVPDGVRSLMPAKSAKGMTARAVMAPAPQPKALTNAPGLLLQKWTAGRWVVSAPSGKKLQASTFSHLDANGQPHPDNEFFTLPYFGMHENRVTSNVPNVAHMYFRAVPVSAVKSAIGEVSVPKWFLDADKKTK